MILQLILCSIFCKRKLHLQSKEKIESDEILNASAILEILDKLNLLKKTWVPMIVLGSIKFSFSHRQRFQGLCFR